MMAFHRYQHSVGLRRAGDMIFQTQLRTHFGDRGSIVDNKPQDCPLSGPAVYVLLGWKV